ncbi:uncharacterized protein SPPG_00869 [Spizellomyces punctatus DAOM BR117]|uniref:UspA domain-containing protein n=1 Tax=Spizellomyces punctatus (strain DAOM BR117) TaxID=645134 RepID=A0A0L0HR14_SPIPD|nr:uncharacterized protein SPPG_00869 [Spizellomyces punctatus DAOM BR117]KND03380.1 hypothetical protein SPPG_00869 [Spizellomyces punctatus DAOM BR117]|eukprot:XP_016611419.1 hypothetical protein SPPG_00869 [Spizellomyces punctatus DAOM BR117]
MQVRRKRVRTRKSAHHRQSVAAGPRRVFGGAAVEREGNDANNAKETELALKVAVPILNAGQNAVDAGYSSVEKSKSMAFVNEFKSAARRGKSGERAKSSSRKENWAWENFKYFPTLSLSDNQLASKAMLEHSPTSNYPTEHIFLGYDETPHSYYALEWTITNLLKPNDQLTVFNARNKAETPPPEDTQLVGEYSPPVIQIDPTSQNVTYEEEVIYDLSWRDRSEAKERITRVVESLAREKGKNMNGGLVVAVDIGDAKSHIVKLARNLCATLIVVGARPRAALARSVSVTVCILPWFLKDTECAARSLMHTSTSAYIAKYAGIPSLVVRTPPEEIDQARKNLEIKMAECGCTG